MPGDNNNGGSKEKMEFDITVTRDGEVIPQRRIATKGGDDVDDRYATMDTDRPIGVIGMDFYTHELLIDNAQVFRNGENYSGWFNTEGNTPSIWAWIPENFITRFNFPQAWRTGNRIFTKTMKYSKQL